MGYVVIWILGWIAIGIALFRLFPQGPDGKGSYVIGIGGGFVGSLFLLIFVTIIWPIRSDAEKAAAAQADAEQAVVDACRDDWHRCKDNAMLVNEAHIYASAVVACKQEADQEARYGHPDLPFLAFGHFNSGDSYIKSGVMILREPDAGFQNGFGATARVTVTCWYDMNKQAVVDMQLDQH